MQMVQFSCPACTDTIVADLAHVGRAGSCPHCYVAVSVPYMNIPPPRLPGEAGERATGAGSTVVKTPDEKALPLQEPADAPKRNHIRFSLPGASVSYSIDRQRYGPYPLLNISLGGFALRLPASGPLPQPGQRLQVEILPAPDAEPLILIGTVARASQPQEDQVSIDVGIQLPELSSAGEERILDLIRARLA